MRVPTKAALVLAGACTFYSIGAAVAPPFAVSLPLMQHHVQASLTGARCLDGQPAWAATLSITSDVAHGTATIQGATNGEAPVPFTHEYMTQSSNATMTFDISVRYPAPDTFVSDTIHLSVNRPAGGCLAPPSTTTSTTTCDQANPPRGDCGEVATTAPTFAPPTTITPLEPTTAAPTVDSTPQITQPATPATVRRVVPSTPTAALPATGSTVWVVVALGLGLVVVGAVALRFRGKNEDES